jgi:hypothetical protein
MKVKPPPCQTCHDGNALSAKTLRVFSTTSFEALVNLTIASDGTMRQDNRFSMALICHGMRQHKPNLMK